MNKRGDFNFWWIVIGVILAITVLFVSIYIFTNQTDKGVGNIGTVQDGLGNCIESPNHPDCLLTRRDAPSSRLGVLHAIS